MSPAQWAQPTEIVTARSPIGSSAIAARSRSAARAAPARSAAGWMTTNSSPPQRASSSPPRMARASRRATSARTSSPPWWPCVSLTLLEVVDVDPRERQRVAVADGERDRALELVRAVAAVGETGEVVGERLLGEPPVRVDERVVELLHAQRRGHARLQLGGVERLAQVVVRTGAQRGQQQRLLVLGGEHDHRHRGEAVVGAQPGEHVEAAEPRQLVVEQDRVRPALCDERERPLAVGGGHDLVAAVGELLLEQRAVRVRVVDDEEEIGLAGAHLLSVTAFRA